MAYSVIGKWRVGKSKLEKDWKVSAEEFAKDVLILREYINKVGEARIDTQVLRQSVRKQVYGKDSALKKYNTLVDARTGQKLAELKTGTQSAYNLGHGQPLTLSLLIGSSIFGYMDEALALTVTESLDVFVETRKKNSSKSGKEQSDVAQFIDAIFGVESNTPLRINPKKLSATNRRIVEQVFKRLVFSTDKYKKLHTQLQSNLKRRSRVKTGRLKSSIRKGPDASTNAFTSDVTVGQVASRSTFRDSAVRRLRKELVTGPIPLPIQIEAIDPRNNKNYSNKFVNDSPSFSKNKTLRDIVGDTIDNFGARTWPGLGSADLHRFLAVIITDSSGSTIRKPI